MQPEKHKSKTKAQARGGDISMAIFRNFPISIHQALLWLGLKVPKRLDFRLGVFVCASQGNFEARACELRMNGTPTLSNRNPSQILLTQILYCTGATISVRYAQIRRQRRRRQSRRRCRRLRDRAACKKSSGNGFK